jgi:hypothetical protein
MKSLAIIGSYSDNSSHSFCSDLYRKSASDKSRYFTFNWSANTRRVSKPPFFCNVRQSSASHSA